MSQQVAAATSSHFLKLLKNFSFLVLGRAGGDAFIFLLFVVLSRVYGPEGIGHYSFAIGLTGYFAVFSDFGLFPLSVKELARRSDSLRAYFGQIVALRAILTAAALGALLAVAFFLPFPNEIKLIVGFVGIYQVFTTLVGGFAAVFISQERSHLAGLLETSLKAVATLVAILLALGGSSLVVTLLALPAMALLQLFFAFWLVAREYGRPQLVTSWSSLIELGRRGVPYALSLFSVQVYTRTDVVFLGFFLGASATGIYNAAFRVIFLLTLIPQFAAFALFPMASRLYADSPDELKALYHRSLNLAILMGLPFAAGVWLVAPDVINIVFGETFAQSAQVLRLLAGVLLLTFLSRILGIFLMACDRQNARAKILWVVASVSILGNLVLIPTWGINGAAVAALTSESLLVALSVLQIRGVLGWPKVSSRLVIGCIGAALFLTLFSILLSPPLILVIPASVLLYLGALTVFKETRNNEVRMIVTLLRRQSL